jgi:replicative DNA helicase
MQALLNIINRFQGIRGGNENSTAIKSGHEILDRILGGGFSKGLYVIAGKESIGKTAFIISLISNIIYKRMDSLSVGIISLDLSEQLWIERLLSCLSEVWLEKIARGRLEEHELKRIYHFAQSKEFNKIEIAAPGYMTIHELVDTCNRWVSWQDVQIIFIDYLQLISIENTGNRELKIFTISKVLKKLSIDLNVPVIVTVPLEPGKKSVSNLKELRKIGAIEVFADVIMFLNRSVDNNTQENEKNKQEIHIRISKNNSGALDTIRLRALLHIQKFIEFD